MIYGGFENLAAHAIGGRAYYHPGSYTVRIQEDRLPAPLLAGYFPDGSTLAVLNPSLRGETTAAEVMTVTPSTKDYPKTKERILTDTTRLLVSPHRR